MRSLVAAVLGLSLLLLPACTDRGGVVLGGDGVRCQKDADCHSPACGPCTSGAALSLNSPSCAVNPCPGVPVVCSPSKICVVK